MPSRQHGLDERPAEVDEGAGDAAYDEDAHGGFLSDVLVLLKGDIHLKLPTPIFSFQYITRVASETPPILTLKYLVKTSRAKRAACTIEKDGLCFLL